MADKRIGFNDISRIARSLWDKCKQYNDNKYNAVISLINTLETNQFEPLNADELIEGMQSVFQKQNDIALLTKKKTIVGSINELYDKLKPRQILEATPAISFLSKPLPAGFSGSVKLSGEFISFLQNRGDAYWSEAAVASIDRVTDDNWGCFWFEEVEGVSVIKHQQKCVAATYKEAVWYVVLQAFDGLTYTLLKFYGEGAKKGLLFKIVPDYPYSGIQKLKNEILTGYHRDMAVGKADVAGQLVDGKAAVSDTASYRLRTSGGSKDIETGVSAIIKMYGRTEKQYIKNGDFKTSEGWTNTGGSLSISKGLLSWAHGGNGYNDARSSYVIRVIKNHKILVLGFTRFSENTTNGNIYTNPATAGEGMQKNVINTLTVKDSWAVTGQICSYDRSGDVRIILGSSYNAGSSAKIAWVKMYDLTELGLEHLATVQQAAAYFGGGYCEGLQGANLLAKHTTGFNQFSPAGRGCRVIKNHYIVGTAGEDEGEILPNAGSTVICFPCAKSEVGSGKNNGYRIHTPGFADGYTVIGWSPFGLGDTKLDTILQLDSVLNKNTIDYSNNGDGYIYVSLKTTDDAVINKIIAHFKHSYTDFTRQYAEESQYKLNTKALLSAPLNSVKGARDIIDLAARKKTTRVGIKVLDGAENWRKHLEDVYFFDLQGAPGRHFFCSGYNTFDGPKSEMEDQTCSWSSDSNFYVCDRSVSSVEELKAKLAGLYSAENPVTVYYVLAEPVITDIEVGSNAQSINDFGTEELEYEGAMPEITTEYYNNLVDKLRNLPAPSEVAVVNPSKGDNSALRALFTAAGAIYNKATGFYELNGLTDITEEEMIVIYNSSSPLQNMPWRTGQYSGTQMRTNLPPSSNSCRYFIRNSGENVFDGCPNVEIIRATFNPTSTLHMQGTTLNRTFAKCFKLRVVIGALYVRESAFKDAFMMCYELIDVNLYYLSNPVSFLDSPKLSNESILYMIKNAANGTKDITITLHPEAKARIAGNAEIQAAITTNGHITIL